MSHLLVLLLDIFLFLFWKNDLVVGRVLIEEHIEGEGGQQKKRGGENEKE